jgi:uncharacterized protein (DUF1697 family)
MALVVFLRAVNVGGHNAFRPSVLARELSEYGVVNIGAAGTFVVRKAVSQQKFRRELLNRLAFPTDVMICEGRALAGFAADDPFAGEPSGRDIVRFVSVLSKPLAALPAIPMKFPEDGEWVLKITGCRSRFLFGLYKRQMKAISYLGRVEKLVGVPATTRNWNTITAIVKALPPASTR